MAEEDTGSTSENVEVTDSQVEKFFESGGEEQKEEVKEKPSVEVIKEEPKEKFVPHQALHEERERRKELQQKVQSMESRFQQLIESVTPVKNIPTLDEDPVQNFDARVREIEQTVTRQKEHQQQQEQEAAVVNAYRQAAESFSKETPDFPDAYKHYISGRTSELQAMGLNVQTAMQQVKQEEFWVALRCLQAGDNPAEKLYEAAKVRGYAKNVAEKETAEKKLETISKGQQAAKLSGASSASGKLTLEALAEMDEEDFLKNWDKVVHNS